MKIADSTVLITGANRGIGLAFAQALMARGARLVARDAARRDAGVAGSHFARRGRGARPAEMTRQVKRGLSSAPVADLAAR